MPALATLDAPPVSLAEQVAYRLRALPPDKRAAAWRRIVAEHPEGENLIRSWRFWGRPEQWPPGSPGAAIAEAVWRWWFVRAGRGWGKTRVGAEFALDRSEQFAEAGVRHRIGGVAPTAGDARDTMVEGESGILAVAERRGYRADYQPSKRRVMIYVDPKRPARLTLYSAERPDRLRGPQHHTVWLEEFAAWPGKVDAHGNTAWTNADFGLRLPCPPGLQPQGVITTTPKPIPPVKALDADAERPGSGVIRTTGALTANLRNLAPEFVAAVLARYPEGSTLALQEILGLLIDVVEGALWTPEGIEAHRVHDQWTRATLPDGIDLIVVAVDPAGSTTTETGIVVVGANTVAGIAYTLEDCTLAGHPEEWGRAAVDAYHRWGANVIVGESNYGGEMVRSTIMAVKGGADLPYEPVNAKVGKRLRAEPVAALAVGGRAVHVGYFGALEGEQTGWVPPAEGERRRADESPNRLDAYVHAVTRCLPDLVRPPASATSPNRGGRTERGARWSPGASSSAGSRRRGT